MSKKLFNFFTTMFVIFGMLATTSSALADSNKGGSKGEVSGTISAVGAGSLTITPKKGGAAITVTVDASTRIRRGGKTAMLSDLLVGERVEAKYDKTSFIASRIEDKAKVAKSDSKKGEIKGAISAITLGTGTVTITPSKGGADVVLMIDSSTRFERGVLHITLADLVVGDKVEAKFNPTTMLASKIETK